MNTGNASVRCVLIVVRSWLSITQSVIVTCLIHTIVKEYVVWSGGVLFIPDSPGVRFSPGMSAKPSVTLTA